MAEQIKNSYNLVSQRDIDDLKAIYGDYLYMARDYEAVFSQETVDNLSFMQIKHMYPDCKDPSRFVIPWQIEKLNADEKQEFKDYTENSIAGDGHKTYVSLQHLRPEDNNSDAPIFAIEPYHNATITMQLPAMIEKFTLSYPESATIGNTEFHIDGRYKATYYGDVARNKPLAECVNDPDLVTKITLMIYLGECYRQNGYSDDNKFVRMAVNVYAAEVLGRYENNLLETLGSFAEKVRDICHTKYHQKDGLDDIKKAQKEGFLNLSDDFQDYFRIRDFLRHQWDSLEDLDDFSAEKSEDNKKVRSERVNSMLKFCDKTVHQRMTLFIKALHQMQQIISELDPNLIVRDIHETNNKFEKRVKSVCQLHPDQPIEVEMNYPLIDKKYVALNGILNKKKIFPNIRIVDDFTNADDKSTLMDDYGERSNFLRNFHGIECYTMGFCQRRGKDKNNNRMVWFYLKDIGLITPEECQAWQDYTSLRNDIAHNYFDKNLRKRLNDIKNDFFRDFNILSDKLCKANPIATKIQDNVFEYEHNDGKIIQQDFNQHTISPSKQNNKEVYPNGMEYDIKDRKIVKIKLPNGIIINLGNQSISWDKQIHWYTNAENYNVLQTANNKIFTDKELKATKCMEKNRNIPFRGGDSLLLDRRHNILLDTIGRIKEFKFKNCTGEILRTTFKHTKEGYNLISLPDGTNILQNGQEMMIAHGDKTLTLDNRKEFAATYVEKQISPQQITKIGNSR